MYAWVFHYMKINEWSKCKQLISLKMNQSLVPGLCKIKSWMRTVVQSSSWRACKWRSRVRVLLASWPPRSSSDWPHSCRARRPQPRSCHSSRWVPLPRSSAAAEHTRSSRLARCSLLLLLPAAAAARPSPQASLPRYSRAPLSGTSARLPQPHFSKSSSQVSSRPQHSHSRPSSWHPIRLCNFENDRC